MSRRDDRVSLTDMLSHAQEAVELLGNRSREELEHSRILQLALTRLVEIVGEAGNRVSEVTRTQSSEIPWRQIIGMRNRLVHGYDVIDLGLLYDTISSDLPPLIQMLRRILEEPGAEFT